MEINNPILYVVVPCYNEEEVLTETANRIKVLIEKLINTKTISSLSKVVFVDDGSRDNTWEIIDSLHTKNSIFSGVKLSRNCGHQKALFAGLMEAKKYADCVISIDADLQDDISVIEEFVDKYKEGYEVIYGVRKKRDKDTFFKKTTAQFFYKLMKSMGVNIVYNHADYRLLSKRALDNLQTFNESNLFLRGLVPLIGYKSTNVYYDRNERFAGESKYPLKKMLAFALDGITSFSTTPIRTVLLVGFAVLIVSIFSFIYIAFSWLNKSVVPGWTSLIISLWFLGGVQLISLGLIGEYIGKIYIETKSRPKYFIDKVLNKSDM